MAPHFIIFAWKIPWTEEPGRLQSMGSLRVGHGWVTSLSLFAFMHWRRKWQPTPVFLPGESKGQGSLVCCCLWGRTESTRLKWLSSSSSQVDHKFPSRELRRFFISIMLHASSGAKSCLTLCDPKDCSLPGFLCPGDVSGKNTGVGCHFLLLCTCLCTHICVFPFSPVPWMHCLCFQLRSAPLLCTWSCRHSLFKHAP